MGVPEVELFRGINTGPTEPFPEFHCMFTGQSFEDLKLDEDETVPSIDDSDSDSDDVGTSANVVAGRVNRNRRDTVIGPPTIRRDTIVARPAARRDTVVAPDGQAMQLVRQGDGGATMSAGQANGNGDAAMYAGAVNGDGAGGGGTANTIMLRDPMLSVPGLGLGPPKEGPITTIRTGVANMVGLHQWMNGEFGRWNWCMQVSFHSFVTDLI